MSQTPNQSPKAQGKDPSRLMQMVKRMGQMLLSNWATKLLSLVLAIVLWGGLITQDPTLTREKSYRDVAVTVSGSDTLKRNGFIVTSNLDELLDGVSLTVEVPQMQYANAQAGNYNARIDLSRIKQAGEQEVNILTTNSSTYGTVTKVSPATVLVTVEEYVAEGYIPVNVLTEGEAPEGYYASAPTCDPARITVSGPRSLVETVDRAEVVIKLDELPAREGLVEKAVSFTLVDKQGQTIDSDMLQVTSESVLRTRINVSVRMYTRREVALDAQTLYRGKPAEGYEVTDVYVSPESISVAGERTALDALNMFPTSKLLNVTGATETLVGVVEPRIPGNIPWTSTEQVTVTVVIEPIRVTRRFGGVAIRVEGVEDGLSAKAARRTAVVSLTGEAVWVQMLTTGDLKLVCDASGLEPGVHEVPLQCIIEGSDGREYTVDIDPLTVQVTVEAR